MKNTLTQEQFINEFMQSSRGKSFSREALEHIYDIWSDYDLEYDPIAIDCEFSERTLQDIKQDYDDINSFADLSDKTLAIELENGKILYNYNF